MKKCNGRICAPSSDDEVQGTDRGQANASAEAAERAQIELDHKGPNVHRGPRYCQHSCPIQWALKGKSYLKTEFTGYSRFSFVSNLSSRNITCNVEKSASNKGPVDQLPWSMQCHNILAKVQIIYGNIHDVWCWCEDFLQKRIWWIHFLSFKH